MYILRPLHLFKLLSSLLYQFSLNLSLFHTTIYHVYICIFWDVLRCPCTIVLSQVVVQLNLTALVSKSLESATARYQTRTETQRAQLSLEPSNKAQEVQALEISNDNLATTPRGRHFLLRLVLAARLLAPASENACIPGNAPVKTTGLPKILAFFWWQIYRNCSENMALVSTRAKRAKKRPRGPGSARWPPIVRSRLGRCHCCSFVRFAQFVAVRMVTPAWTGSVLSEAGHVAWAALPRISKFGQICCDAWGIV